MANYPDLIHFDEDTYERLRDFLDTELQRHHFERSKFSDDLINMQHSYWAEPDSGEVTFPFQGASKIVVPLNAIAIEAIHAREMNTVFGSGQLVSLKAISPQWDDARAPVENFLNKELKNNVKVRRPIDDFSLERAKFGTGILKSGYEKITRTAVRMIDGERKEMEVTVKQGATLDAVPLANFVMPFAYLNEQMAAWCGEIHNSTPHEVRIHEESGLFYPGTYDKLYPAPTNDGMLGERRFERNQEELDNHQVTLPMKVSYYEIWLSWNTDKNPDGSLKEIVVHYHRDTRTLMSARYNWYDDLHRPYRKAVYFPIEHRWYGLGIIKQNDQFQEEVTTRIRQQLDNATLANMRMIKVSKGTQYAPGEPVFPGKMWFLDEMDQVETIQLGEIYPSAYNTISSALTFSQQRTGINELTLGQQAVGTPGTASDVLSRIQEGNKKFGYLFDNLKATLDEAFLDVTCNIQQFGPRYVEYYDTAENGKLVQQFFTMPEAQVRGGLLLELVASSQLDNKLLDRQNFLNITQTFQQYISGLMGIAEQTQDGQLLMMLKQKAVEGGTELMRQFLESFDLRNLDRMLINVQQLQQSQSTPGGTGGITPPAQTGGSLLLNPGNSQSQPNSL